MLLFNTFPVALPTLLQFYLNHLEKYDTEMRYIDPALGFDLADEQASPADLGVVRTRWLLNEAPPRTATSTLSFVRLCSRCPFSSGFWAPTELSSARSSCRSRP